MIPLLQHVVSNIIVATLIAVLAWQVGRSGRRAKLAHVLWIIFFVKLITPPIILLPIVVPQNWVPPNWIQTADSSPQSAADVILATDIAGTPSDLPSVELETDPAALAAETTRQSAWPRTSILSLLAMIWCTGTLVVVLRSMIRFTRFHRLIHREGELDEEATEFVQQLLDRESGRVTHEATSSSAPKVLRLPIRVSPMLFGFGRRAVIVCPDRLWQSLSTADRQAFLAHESAHFNRRDHWVRWLEWVVTAVYWWFPAVYYGRNQLERHEEACCDAWAVSRLNSSPRSYAEALLQVVDFISEYNVGIPRLASGMRPTDSLEERLRLLMKPPQTSSSSSFHLATGAACFSLWLIHPVAKVDTYAEEIKSVESWNLVEPPVSPDASIPTIDPTASIDLPSAPSGFWNQAVSRQWANFSLSLPGARLTAQASRDITIEIPGRSPLLFKNDEMSAIAEVQQTHRVIVGNRTGQLRLWDLAAGMPVSLIGQHVAPITSLAFHEDSGLVSADQRGSVMRWDMQSGQILATWSTKQVTPLFQTIDEATSKSHPGQIAAVESVRFSRSGETLAILTGSWSDYGANQQVHFVDSQTLNNISAKSVSSGAAIVVDDPALGWVVVDWSGTIRSLETNSVVDRISKQNVSAIVFSHCAALHN